MQLAIRTGPVALPALALPALALLALAPRVHASPPADDPVHVDAATGDDTNGDGSEAAPWRSITKALSQVAPDGTILVGPGNYRSNSGEDFPLLVPGGVSVIATSNRENTRVVGIPVGTLGVELTPTFLVEAQGIGAAHTRIAGFDLRNGRNGVRVQDTGPDQRLTVELEGLNLNDGMERAIEVIADDGGRLDVTLTQVFAGLVPRALRLAADEGHVRAAVTRSKLDGLVIGIELEARGAPGTGQVELLLSTTRVIGGNTNGIRSIVSEGNSIRTRVRDSLFAFVGICFSPFPMPTVGALHDEGADLGQVTHDIARTIFFQSGQTCDALVHRDLTNYRPEDYVLADNVYGSSGLPGGVVSDLPGFVDPSKSGFDWRLLPDGPAVDLSSTTRPQRPDGDIQGDFPSAAPGSDPFAPGAYVAWPCFPGTADAGPDERRELAMYPFPALRVGKSSELRVLGPPRSGPDGTPALMGVFVGPVPLEASQCPVGLELPTGAFLLDTVVADPATGLGIVATSVPDDASLAGRELGVQVALWTGATLRWSRARGLLIRR